jgi:transcriptional regulator with XRE-family HTH domain
MPLNNEVLYTISRHDFCLALKAARERKGITLAEIASATKIPAYLFAGLERNDLRRWPKGLFRRSFFRDYAKTIGLPVADACAEFVRFFPDEPGAEVANTTPAATEPEQDSDLPMALDPEWHGPRASILLKLLAASIDAAIVIVVAAAIAWLAGTDRPTATAICALAYFSLATAVFGESPTKWAIVRREAIWNAFANGEAAAEPELDPEGSHWISDAHRVGPSRLRVRIKVS